MADALSIALTGMQAQSQRLAGSASNIANVTSRGAIAARDGTQPAAGAQTPYQPLATGQTDLRTGNGQGAGTRAYFRPSSAPVVAQYDPTDPLANKDGTVGAPNVDEGAETVQQITARAAYQASARIARASDEMTKGLLDIRS